MYNDEEVTWFKWTPYLYAHTISLNQCIDSLCLDTHITWVTFKGCLWNQVGSRRSKGMKVDDRAKIDALFKNHRPVYPKCPKWIISNDWVLSDRPYSFKTAVQFICKSPSSFCLFFCLTVWFQDRPLSQTDQFHVPRIVHFDPWSSNFSLDTLAIWPKIELTIPIENELGGWVTLIKIVIIVRANN